MDQLFFPSGLAMAPDGSALFVASSNSELRYDSGTVDVIDLATVQTVIDGWTGGAKTVPSGCSQDLDHPESLVCDEAQFIRIGAGVRIGNFATDIAIQNFSATAAGNDAAVRLFIPTRGDPSIAWADYVGGNLSCAGPTTGGFGLCDDAHRLTAPDNDPNTLGIPDEPFGVYADAKNNFAIVTHQTTGGVTLINSPRDADATIADVKYDVFAIDLNTGLRGSTSVAGRIADDSDDIIYVGSRTEDRVQTFTVVRPINNAPPYLLANQFFFLDSVGGSTDTGTGGATNTGGSTDTRGMQFSKDGQRMYLTNRMPPSLQVFDTSIGPEGSPRNVATGATDICRQASTLTVVGSGDAERVYLTCFQDGQVYVVDPAGQAQVEDIISVGRGPYTIVASEARQQLYISNFLEDTVAVVDVNPSSPLHNRVVLRIGTPRPL